LITGYARREAFMLARAAFLRSRPEGFSCDRSWFLHEGENSPKFPVACFAIVFLRLGTVQVKRNRGVGLKTTYMTRGGKNPDYRARDDFT
jgi:hypothetical protein